MTIPGPQDRNVEVRFRKETNGVTTGSLVEDIDYDTGARSALGVLDSVMNHCHSNSEKVAGVNVPIHTARLPLPGLGNSAEAWSSTGRAHGQSYVNKVVILRNGDYVVVLGLDRVGPTARLLISQVARDAIAKIR